MADVEVDSLFEHSAEAIRKAQITQTGCVYFLMQACVWVITVSNSIEC
jgi:hypothetical protein